MSDQTFSQRDQLGRFVKRNTDSVSPKYDALPEQVGIGKSPDCVPQDRLQMDDRSTRSALPADDGRDSDGGLIVVLAAVVLSLVICLLWGVWAVSDLELARILLRQR